MLGEDAAEFLPSPSRVGEERSIPPGSDWCEARALVAANEPIARRTRHGARIDAAVPPSREHAFGRLWNERRDARHGTLSGGDDPADTGDGRLP